MPLNNFVKNLQSEVESLRASGTAKGIEQVVVKVIKANEQRGPRFLLEGNGDKEFLRMNSNSYLGLSLNEEVLKAEEAGALAFGAGPGAVRFISGSYAIHNELERKLSDFHNREACMITSSAYISVMGVISSLTTPETVIISDELNHNCIINAMKLARPKAKKIFDHLDLEGLEKLIENSRGICENIIVITDGVFSMRGDYAPLDKIAEICRKHNDKFPRDIILIVDDSHGVGALGKTGRGTEELTGADGVDILIGTLGKAFGVNGGYIVTNRAVIDYLREKNSFYIYTNPVTPSEAAAACKSIDLVNSDYGVGLLAHLRKMTEKFESGLISAGFETISSAHPVVPLLVRDTNRTTKLVKHLFENGILATGLNYPVVPKGDELIRFQVSAEHKEYDIGYARAAIRQLTNRNIKKLLRQALDNLLEDHQVYRLEIEGQPYFTHPDTLSELPLRLGRRLVHILSPFDNLTINRRRMLELFHFDYQLECYVPAPKRRYGYFCLPLLYGDTLVGRLDAKAQRKINHLEVRNLVLEDKVKINDDLIAALKQGLLRFAQGNECKSISVLKTTPGSLKKILTRELAC